MEESDRIASLAYRPQACLTVPRGMPRHRAMHAGQRQRLGASQAKPSSETTSLCAVVVGVDWVGPLGSTRGWS